MSESAFRWTGIVAIALTALIAYANSFTNDFVWDDASSIQINKHVQDPQYLGQLFREDQHPFGRGQGNFYRPLVAVSFMADFLIAHGLPSGGETAGVPVVSSFVFHLTNTLWHVAAAVLLFALLCRMQAPRFVCASVALLYVAHPLHTEAITYISGRADPMCATFLFAGLWFAIDDKTRTRRIVGTILSAFCFCGALLCKEAGTIFPVLLLLLAIARPVHSPLPSAQAEGRGETWARAWPIYRGRIIQCAVAFVVLGVYAYLRMTALKFAATVPPQIPLGRRIVETCQSLALYFKLILVPTGLHMERTLDGVPGWVGLIGSLLLVLCIIVLAFAFRKGQRRIALGLAWFIVTWFPISGLIPLNAPMAEHWMYVPLAGLLWALAEAVYAALDRHPAVERHPWVRKAVIVGVWMAVMYFAALTAARNPAWRDNETIFRDTLAKNPNSVRVHYNLAVTYEDIMKNRPGARREYETVIALYQRQRTRAHGAASDRLWDEEIEAHLSLGRLFFEEQQIAASMDHYKSILSVQADAGHASMVGEAALGMGQCCLAAGDVQRAAECFKKALAIAPGLRGEVERIVSGAASQGRG